MTKELVIRGSLMIKKYDWFFENLQNKVNFCYVRFNDGEMMGIERLGAVAARGDQIVNSSLKAALTDAIKHRQSNYYVGIPCSICYPHLNRLAKEIVGDYKLTTSAVLLTNRNWKYFYDNFSKSMTSRKMLWVGGKDQDPEKLKDYGLNIEKTIRVHNKDSWSFYEDLKNVIPKYVKDDYVVGISLGPTARVLCRRLFEEFPNVTFLDMGSLLDPVTKGKYFDAHKGWEQTGFNYVRRCKECN